MAHDMIIAVDEKGELQLPDEIMSRHGWRPGSRLIAELVPGGLLLKDAPPTEDSQSGMMAG